MNTSRMIDNRFGIGALIGQGSMGEVYRGLDSQTGELVAVKVLRQAVVRSDPDMVERFVREGEALRRLNHPNIVKVLASVIEDAQHYIVMEYVGGGVLEKRLKQEPLLSIGRVLEIGLELSDALVRAHHLNIIHRDIKPQNVLLAPDGTPRLTDFGVAHMSDLISITQSGALVGTLPYLSPEAWQFDEPDERTDIWAFGVLLYEMLAGRRPFVADQPSKIKYAILHHGVPNVRQFRPDVPAPLADLIARMLEKDRDRRIASMRSIGAELEAIARGAHQRAIEVPAERAAAADDRRVPAAPDRALSPDVDLTIASTAAGYTVRLRSALGSGDAHPQPFALPFDLDALPRRRRDVADWVKQARIRRLRANEEVKLAREFGAALFERLFNGAVLAGLHASRAALTPGERLRLRLRLPPDLALIPWELLYDPHQDEFLALAHDLALLRYLEIPTSVAPLRVNGPLQVVAVLASPAGADYPPIRLDRELHRIETVLKGPRAQGRITLDVIRGPGTLDQLRGRLRTPVHVLHVLCHGDLDETAGGVLIFEDADGAPEPVGAELLRTLLQKQRRHMRLVLLNACLGALPASDDPFSSIGAALLGGGVPAVIAMQFELAEDAAAELARVFYAELAAGTPVDLALAEARLHLYGRFPTRLDWAIPVLFLRTDTGALFEVVQPAPEQAPPRPMSPHETIVNLKSLKRLWHLALTAYATNDWEQAAQLLRQVAETNPNHEDVQARLAEARRQLALHPLYRRALALRDDDQWLALLGVLDELEREQPGAPDPDELRAWAERRQRREQRYVTARTARERADWATATTTLEALLAEAPGDAAAQALLDRVRAEQQEPDTWRRQRQDERRAEQGPLRWWAGARDPRASFGPPLGYIERGEFAAALDLLDEQLARRPTDHAAAELAASLIERPDVPPKQRLRAARLAEQAGDPRPGVCTLEPAWCSFPASKYLIGAQRDPFNSATFTAQKLWLDGFQIARYPVTVRQFLRFWEDQMGYANQRWWTPQGWAWKQDNAGAQLYRWGDQDWMAFNQPVAGVSWYEAAAFCAWLTKRRQAAGWLLRNQVIRLPSEAEWEVAATWDANTQQPRLWRPPEGEVWQNSMDAGIGRPTPVGVFPEGASPCGARDMAGNLWEWCSSRYADYPQNAARPQADFAMHAEGPVVRGGAYNTRDAMSGWGARNWYFPNLRHNFQGFRVVLVSNGIWKLPFGL